MDLKHPEDYYIQVLLNKVKLKEIMVENVITLEVNEPFSLVEEKFRQFGIRHLPIVDDKKKLVGIITQRDLYRTVSPRKDEEGNMIYDKDVLDNYILKHIMTKNPFTLTAENSVAEALLAMVDKKYGVVPIVDKNNFLCGIVTQIDILRLGARIIREGPKSA